MNDSVKRAIVDTLGRDNEVDRYYVYALCEETDDGYKPFYIGKGQIDRVWQHEEDAKKLTMLRDFRNKLLEMREDTNMRDHKRRNGAVYKKADGTFGMGPFTLEARRVILEGLLELENKTGLELITIAELKVIDKMWDEEGDLTCRRLVDIYRSVKGKKLSWDDYKVSRFDDEAIDAIEEIAEKYSIPVELFTKLIVSVDTNKHMTHNNKMQKAFDKIISQEWLHYDMIEGGLNNENSEDSN